MDTENRESKAPNLPAPAHGAWRIEMRYHPIYHRGHAFLALIDPEGTTVDQLHGVAESRHTKQITNAGMDGAQLVAPLRHWMGLEVTHKIADVAAGTHDEIVKDKWRRGRETAEEINRRNFDYKAHDPSYEAGSRGGQIQNSNSVAYTFGKVMDLPLGDALREAGMERRFSGWGHDLLDPGYKPYSAPPLFGVSNAP